MKVAPRLAAPLHIEGAVPVNDPPQTAGIFLCQPGIEARFLHDALRPATAGPALPDRRSGRTAHSAPPGRFPGMPPRCLWPWAAAPGASLALPAAAWFPATQRELWYAC